MEMIQRFEIKAQRHSCWAKVTILNPPSKSSGWPALEALGKAQWSAPTIVCSDSRRPLSQRPRNANTSPPGWALMFGGPRVWRR